MQKITAALLDKLIRLCNGERLSGSLLKGGLFDELQKEQLVTSISHGSRLQFFTPNGNALREFLKHYDDSFKDLEGSLKLLRQQEDLSRAEQVQIAGNSKIKMARTCKGFLVNTYHPMECFLNDEPFTIAPIEGTYLFIADFENFSIPANAIVVGIENMENFRYIRKQRHLFDSLEKPILFVSRYPQSGDLIRWLKNISNEYLHFGDFDLAGIHIYLTEFYAHLQERGKFFIPNDVEERIKEGSRERYDNQFQKFGNMKISDLRVKPLVDLLHKYHKGYDQEGYIKKDEGNSYTLL